MGGQLSVAGIPLPRIAGLPQPRQIRFDPGGLPDPLGILHLYAAGLFPMADESGTVEWYLPRQRAVFPLGEMRITRSLAQRVRSGRFQVEIDRDFAAVVRGCSNRDDTWIGGGLVDMYGRLHEMGHAHSVETWRDGQLVGGLFGLALGGAFIGESMYSLEADASKVCMAHLVARLVFGGFRLFDAQVPTPHLESLGAVTLPHETFVGDLVKAVGKEASFDAMPANLAPQTVLEIAGLPPRNG